MRRRFGIAIAIFLVAAGAAVAQSTVGSNQLGIDTMWTLIAAFLVFFMQAGFAMLEAGFTQAKNAANIMMKNLMDFSIGSIAFWAVGFGIMFGADRLGLFGSDQFFLIGTDPETDEGKFNLAFWLFQTVFAATAATIVSGAVAERTRFPAYLVYSLYHRSDLSGCRPLDLGRRVAFRAWNDRLRRVDGRSLDRRMGRPGGRHRARSEDRKIC